MKITTGRNSSSKKDRPEAQFAINSVGLGKQPTEEVKMKNDMRKMKNQLIMNQNFSLLSTRMKFPKFKSLQYDKLDGTKSAVMTKNLQIHEKKPS